MTAIKGKMGVLIQTLSGDFLETHCLPVCVFVCIFWDVSVALEENEGK